MLLKPARTDDDAASARRRGESTIFYLSHKYLYTHTHRSISKRFPLSGEEEFAERSSDYVVSVKALLVVLGGKGGERVGPPAPLKCAPNFPQFTIAKSQ
jgi:hypothetical protein